MKGRRLNAQIKLGVGMAAFLFKTGFKGYALKMRKDPKARKIDLRRSRQLNRTTLFASW